MRNARARMPFFYRALYKRATNHDGFQMGPAG